MEDLLPFDENQKIIFSQKPISIPSDLRPIYKMSQILLMLKFNGYKERLSIVQIQYLNWLLKHQEELVELNIKKDTLPFDIIHLDNTVKKALDYCLGEKLINILDNGKFELLSKGKKMVNLIIEEKIMKKNIKILKTLSKQKVSETQIKKIISGN